MTDLPDPPKQPTRQFKGVWIPRALWDAIDLGWTRKCLLAEIDLLDPGDGCFASNEYLAKLFGTTPGNMAVMISDLRKGGWLEDCGFDGRVRKLRLRAGFGLRQGLVNTKEGLVNAKGSVQQTLNPDAPAVQGENNRIEKELEKGSEAPPPLKSESKPESLEAAKAYGAEIGLPDCQVEKFMDHFASNGWRVSGRAPMKDWKAALRNWKRNGESWGDSSSRPAPTSSRGQVGEARERQEEIKGIKIITIGPEGEKVRYT